MQDGNNFCSLQCRGGHFSKKNFSEYLTPTKMSPLTTRGKSARWQQLLEPAVQRWSFLQKYFFRLFDPQQNVFAHEKGKIVRLEQLLQFVVQCRDGHFFHNDKGDLCNKCCTARRWIRYPWSSNQAGSFSVSFHCPCFKTFRFIFSCCKIFPNVRGRNDNHINFFAHFLNVKSSLQTANCQLSLLSKAGM